MPDLFDEIGEDLRAERAQLLLRRYGWMLGVAVLVLLIGVGAWQAWTWRLRHQASATATIYAEAMQLADKPAGEADAHARAIALFMQVAGRQPDSYRVLARLRAAALKADAGDQQGALALWDQVIQDKQAEPKLRDLARLLWVQHGLDGGDEAEIAARLKPVLAPENPFHGLAQEEQALLDLRAGRKDEADAALRQLRVDPSAPNGVRERAGMLLAGQGE